MMHRNDAHKISTAKLTGQWIIGAFFLACLRTIRWESCEKVEAKFMKTFHPNHFDHKSFMSEALQAGRTVGNR